MFRHSILIIYRNFLRFKSSFFINLIGLSTGLACALLIYLWVNDELNIDSFHENDSRLYQAMINHHNSDGISTTPTTPAPLAEALAAELPEVEHAVATTFGMDMPPFLLSTEDKSLKAAMNFVGRDFFKIFSYELIAGDPAQVLADKSSIVLSEQLALNLFGTTDNLLGESVTFTFLQEMQFSISGIFKSPPPNSSDQFDFLLSFDVYKELSGLNATDWVNTSPRTFVLLKPDTDLDTFNSKISGFVKSKESTSNAEPFLRPFSDRHLYDTYENGQQAGGRIEYVRLFSIIAIFILLIACINFMNLATAKASHRLKELGVKKAIGAHRQTLITQFLGESILMTLLALLLAILIVAIFLPTFNQITAKQLSLNFNPGFVISVLGIAVFTGFIAGSYPAFYLSGLSVISALKGRFSPSSGEGLARKGLVVFQFTLSVLFIVSVLVVYRQIEYIQNKNLGYEKDNVIFFLQEGKVAENQARFLAEVKNIPGVVNASSTHHNMVGHKSRTGIDWEGKNPEDNIPFEMAWVNVGLIETLGIEMVAGRAFSADRSTDSTKIIFNEAAIKVMGLTDPVGKTITMWGEDRQIIGVVKDLHYESFYEKVKPMLFVMNPAQTSLIMVKIEGGREQEVIQKLNEHYTAFNPGFTFDYKFLDDAYQEQYSAEQRVSILSRYFAGLAILISCLGLYGLVAFAAEQRRKEISIRKVLGASVSNIMLLISQDFIKLVSISIVVGSLLAWLAMSRWLEGFVYRIELGWWMFALAGVLALVIALTTLCVQAIKAAMANPVKNLRSE